MAQKSKTQIQASRLSLLALEPRLVFDGALSSDGVQHLSDGAAASLFDVKDTSAQPAALRQAQTQTQQAIAAWMQQGDAVQKLATLFGGTASPSVALGRAQALVDAFQQGQVHVRMELRSSAELNGAWGAFAAQGPDGQPVIYLNADWLGASQTSTQDVSRVMAEEWGHYLDTWLNGRQDTAGDEGEAFADEVFHVSLSDADRQRIATENDHLWITIDKQAVEVEMASLLFTGKVFALTPSTALLEQNSITLGAALTDGSGAAITRTLFVSDPESAATYSGNNVRGWLYTIDSTNHVVQRFYGEMSRQQKIGSTTVGLQFYVYNDPTQPGITNQAAQTLLVDVKGADAFVPATGQVQATSSDPIAAALNAMLPKATPAAATADTSTALEAGGITNLTAGSNPSGNLLSNDAGGTSSYRINPVTNMLETVTTGVSLTKVSSTVTGSSGVPTAGSTATTGYTSVTGLYGTLRIGADGSYTYVVDNNNAAVQALRTSANTLSESFAYSIAAGTTTSASTLTVTIQGANDNPVAVNDYNIAKAPVDPTTVNWSTETIGFKATGNVLPNDTDVDAGDTKTVQALTGDAIAGAVTNIPGATTYSFTTSNGWSSVKAGDYAYYYVNGKYEQLRDSAGNAITLVSPTAGNFSLSATPAKYYTATGEVAISSMTGAQIGFDANKVNELTSSNTKYAVVSSSTGSGTSTVSLTLGQFSGTIATGMTVSGTGVPTGTTITGVSYDASGNPTSVTLSGPITTTAGTALSFTATAGTTLTGRYGTLLVNADGSYVYTPTVNPGAGVTVTEVFRYTMQDTAAATSNANLYITLTGSASADPKPVADSVIATEAGGVANSIAGLDPSTTTSITGLLGNDNANGGTNTLTAIRSSQSATETATTGTVSYGGVTYAASVSGLYGTLYVKADGTYQYVVDNSSATVQALRTSGNTLADTFQYKVSNGTGSSYSTLTVTVQGANDAPSAVADSNLAIANSLDPTGNVLPNDSDVDAGDTKTVTKIAAGSTATPSGSMAGSVSYGGVSYNAAVVGQYGTLYIKADGSYKYVVDNSNPAVIALGSTQTVNDVFSYEMSDAAGLRSVTTLTLVVQGSNEAPVDGLPAGSLSVNEGSTLNLTGANAFSTSDVDNNIAAVTISVQNGTLNVNTAGATSSGLASDATFEMTLAGGASVYGTVSGSPLGTSTITFYGTRDQINAALASLSYTPNKGYTGTETFSITSIDTEGLQDTDSKSIAVNAPALTVNNVSVNEGSPYAVFTVGGVAGQSLTLGLSSGTAAVGTDTGASLEYFNGTSWVPYAGAAVTMPASGQLLVRTAISNDTGYEGAETFKLNATNAAGVQTQGTGTITDDGTGSIYLASNNTGTANTSTDSGYPAQLNDDRPLTVNSITVNEASLYATFSVGGAAGQLVKLELGNTSSSADHDATLGTDTGNAGTGVPLQYFNGSSWIDYTPGSFVAIPSSGTTLLVRTAITPDAGYEGPETFTLTATNTGTTGATGTGTIVDDGTGTIFAYASNTTATPSAQPAASALDDDRPLAVNSVTVNEGSPYATFTVTGAAGQLTTLALSGQNNDGSNLSALQYWNGSSWANYSSGTVPLDASGQLLVRVALSPEQETALDGPEPFNLVATNTGGTAATGTGTIVDDGTGTVFAYTSNTTATPSPQPAASTLDDDRPLTVNSVTVNEISPYATFSVGGASGQYVSLALGSTGAGSGHATLGTDLGTALQYFDGSSWVNCTGSPVQIPAGSTSVLVRVAITPDSPYEGAETFTLTATNSGGSAATGTGTIVDDGTGSVYQYSTNTSATPLASTDPAYPARLDDDRPLTVSDQTVNESAGSVTFTVSGATGQLVQLALQATTNASNNATLGTDTGTSLEYYNGSAWLAYTAGSYIAIPAGGLQVRTTIARDSLTESPETFLLVATNTGGSSDSGLGTITDNQNPVAVADTVTAVEAGSATSGTGGNANSGTNPTGNVITASDSDPAGDTLTVVSALNAAVSSTATTVTSDGVNITGQYGTLNLRADGSYTYSVNNSTNATVDALRTSSNTLTDTFSYTVSDGYGGTATTTLTVTVQGANDSPVANPDYNVAKESLLADTDAAQYTGTDPLGYTATGNVLPNDTDVDAGDGQSIAGLTGSAQVASVSSSSGSATTLVFTASTTFSPVGNGDEAWLWIDADSDGVKDNGEWRALFSSNGTTQITASAGFDSNTKTIPLSETLAYYYTSSGLVAVPSLSGMTIGFKDSSSTTTETNSSMKSGVVSTTQTTGSSTVSLTVGTPSGSVAAGMVVSGTGVPAGTTISTVNYDVNGAPTSVVLSSTITSVAGTTLTFSAAAGSTVTGRYGTLVLEADGDYTYTPFANNTNLSDGQSVVDSFTYSMRDTLLSPSTSTLNITVLGSGTNDPNAIDDANSVTEAGGAVAAASALGNVLGTAGSGTIAASGDVTDTTPVGTLVVTGVRAPDDANWSSIASGSSVQIDGLYGTLTLYSNGSYSYALNNSLPDVQALGSGDTLLEKFNYQVMNGQKAPTTNYDLQDVATLTITINGTNDAPVLDLNTADGSSNYANTFTEGGAAVSLLTATGVNISDVDSSSFNKLTLSFSQSAFPNGSAEQLLVNGATSGGTLTLGGLSDGTTNSTVVLGGVTYNYSRVVASGTVTLTFTQNGVAAMPQANAEALLDALTYQNTSDDPTTGSNRVFSLSVTDSSNLTSNITTSTITVLPVNDPPVLDLDANNSTTATGADFKGGFTVGGTAVAIADVDSSVSDVDSANMASATIVLTNAKAGDSVAIDASVLASLGLSASGTGTANADGSMTITLSGSATKAAYETALEALRFSATGTNYADRVFEVSVNDGSANSNTAVSTIAVSPDNRALSVAGSTVNEASPYVVFTVSGAANQRTTLELGTSGSATPGVDTANAGTGVPLQVLVNGAWVDYTPGSVVTLDANGKLLVRTAVVNDTNYEGAETLPLIARNDAGTTASGNSTIKDDGTGDIFLAGNTSATPSTSTDSGYPAELNDDRPLSVNSVTVNEASPYATFTVTGAAAGQRVQLTLGNTASTSDADATLGTDLGTALQYFDGSSWQDYTPGSFVAIPNGGTTLLVRVAIRNDSTPDNGETFTLTATNTGGTGATGTGIITDDGTGSVFAYTGNSATPNAQPAASALDDDRPLAVNSITVNEGSPYATFTVTGAPGQYSTLALGGQNSDGSNLSALQYWNGSIWANYTSGTVQLDSNGQLLVRVALSPEQEEALDGPETFTLTATNTGGTGATGTGTIVDDGTGSVFQYSSANTATPLAPTDPAYPVRDDDRPLAVNSVTVNEASPYATFTVTGAAAGQLVKLSLGNTSSSGDADATLGTDLANALQYWNGSSWVSYAPGSFVAIPNGGTTLQVRVAITNDTTPDNGETFTLTATNTGGTGATGIGTITDDGTGSVFQYSGNTATPLAPTDPAYPVLDDDRPLSVNDVSVNEGSPYAVFSVGGAEGQALTLALAGGSATAGTDLANALEYWNGSAWVAYTPGSRITIPADGDSTSNEAANLLVRVAITNDSWPDNGETFTLTATNTGGTGDTGTATIHDDGTGGYFASSPTAAGVSPASASTAAAPQTVTVADPATMPVVDPATTTVLNDDRALTVDSITVNEGSPYGVFTVGGKEGQYVQLSLAGGTATAGTDFANALEYWNGSAWVAYTPGSYVAIPSDGDGTSTEAATLLVRVAITNDAPYEGAETFTLTASNTGGSAATGTGTIVDDGTGDYYPSQAPSVLGGLLTPALNPNAVLNDDRLLSVSNIDVNEGSPYAVFTVKGAAGQAVRLMLADGTALGGSTTPSDGSVDYGQALQYFNPTSGLWADYSPGATVVLDANGQLLVRTAIVQDTPYEGAQTFNLVASAVGGTSATGVGTIHDDGTGSYYPDQAPVLVNGQIAPATNPNAVLDDDRLLSVSNVDVNEGSPYAVFTVHGDPGQQITLATHNGTAVAGSSSPSDGSVDYGSSLQVWDGSGWVTYTPGAAVTLDAAGNVLVRTTIVNDTPYEGPQTFNLVATVVGGNSATGVGTIHDDGTGAYYPDQAPSEVNGVLTPALNPDAQLNDDRPLRVNDVDVNEGSPYAVFTVQGAAGQHILLGTQDGSAIGGSTQPSDGSVDYASALEYFDGSHWVSYTGAAVTLPSTGQLLVRTAIVNDMPYEGAQTFNLVASVVGGTSASGVGTIHDDGTGSFFPDVDPVSSAGLLVPATDPAAVLNDDRLLKIGDVDVNEGSPYAVFTVQGTAGQQITLATQNGSAVGGSTSGAPTDGSVDYGSSL